MNNIERSILDLLNSIVKYSVRNVLAKTKIDLVEDVQRNLVAAQHAFVSAARGWCALARKQPATAAGPSSLLQSHNKTHNVRLCRSIRDLRELGLWSRDPYSTRLRLVLYESLDHTPRSRKSRIELQTHIIYYLKNMRGESK